MTRSMFHCIDTWQAPYIKKILRDELDELSRATKCDIVVVTEIDCDFIVKSNVFSMFKADVMFCNNIMY